MNEPEFWQRLEFRICAEFKGFADRGLRLHWCDGLLPEQYDLAGAERRITGVALCGRSGQGAMAVHAPAQPANGISRSGRLVSASAQRPADRLADTRHAEQNPAHRSSLRIPRLAQQITIYGRLKCYWEPRGMPAPPARAGAPFQPASRSDTLR
jgi:hypothetical protein